MKIFADTNFFTRVYLVTEWEDEVANLLLSRRGSANAPFPITWLHSIEMSNAFELQVFMGKQGNYQRITPEQAAVAQVSFENDLKEGSFIARARLDITRLEEACATAARRHTAKHGFRTYDLLHVSSAVLLKCDTFWSFDAKASKLARLEGLEAPLA